MVPIRVLFLALIVVTVVTVTNGSSPGKFGNKLKSLTENEKLKAKLKDFSDKHPKIAVQGKKVTGKLASLKKSAAESKQGVKARGLAKSTSTKAKNTIDSIKKNLADVKKKVASSKIGSKIPGLKKHNKNSHKRGVTNFDKLKHTVGSGSSKLGGKLSQLKAVKTLKAKASDKLKVITDSSVVKQGKAKLTKLRTKKTG